MDINASFKKWKYPVSESYIPGHSAKHCAFFKTLKKKKKKRLIEVGGCLGWLNGMSSPHQHLQSYPFVLYFSLFPFQRHICDNYNERQQKSTETLKMYP